MTTPKPGSVAYSSAQLMSDYRKVEELVAKLAQEKRTTLNSDEKVLVRSVLNRLPMNKQKQLKPVFDKLLNAN